MQSVRNIGELPSAGDVTGTTRFVGSLMRPVVVRNGQVTQIMSNGNLTVNTSAGAYTVLPSDGVVVYTLATAGTNVYTLPLAADVPKNHTITFKKILGTSVVRLTCAGSDTFEAAGGSTTHDLTAAGRIVTIMSNGVATWYIVQSVTAAAA